MTYNTPTWTEYFNQIATSPLAHALLVGVVIVAALLVLLAVSRKVAKATAVPASGKLSRGARKGLERSGYKVEKTRSNGYKVSKPRTVASYR